VGLIDPQYTTYSYVHQFPANFPQHVYILGSPPKSVGIKSGERILIYLIFNVSSFKLCMAW